MAKYWAIFRTQLATQLAYPLNLLTGSLSILVFMWVFTQLWRATYAIAGSTTQSAGQVIAGLSLPETLWYLMMTETILLSKPRLSRAISEAVKDGSIAYLLNKPYDFLLYQYSVGLAEAVSRVVFYLLLGGGLVWIMLGPPPLSLASVLVAPAILLGWTIDFCFQALIGMAAFVTEDVAAFEWIYQKLLFIAGGMLIPLDFFPSWLQAISQTTPFAFTMYGPARLFVAPGLERFLPLLAGQVAWIAVLAWVVIVFYRKGTARLTINGG